jgi:hypothetical protein
MTVCHIRKRLRSKAGGARSSFFVAALLVISPMAARAAAEKMVDNILSASADSGGGRAKSVTIQARVRLDNTCLSHPRFSMPQARRAGESAGVLTITVVAHSSEGNGDMCAMHVRDVDVPPLVLKGRALAGVRKVRISGSFKSAVVKVDSTSD